MSRVEIVIKQFLMKLIPKPECIPESHMKQIREMHSKLPDRPAEGKVAPVWQKTQTDGQSGENTS